MSVLLVALAVLLPAAEMETFKSKKGFSFAYPAGWVAATKDTLDEVDPENKEKIESRNALRPPVEVFVGDPESDFARNINVVMVEARMAFTEEEANEIQREVRASQDKAGTEVDGFTFEITTIKGVKTYQSDFTAIYGVDIPEIRQRQLYFNGPNNKALIITFTTNDLDEEAMDELFQPIAESFAVSLKPKKKASEDAAGTPSKFKSKNGYSFIYPEGWIAATKETLDDLDPEVKEKLEPRNVLTPPVEVFVGDPKSEFNHNINVASVDARLAYSKEEAEGIQQEVRSSQDMAGTEVDGFTFEITTIKGVKAYQSDFTAIYGGTDTEVRQRQLYFNGPNNRALIITFTTTDLDEEAMDELFIPIGESFADSLKPKEKGKGKAAPGKKKQPLPVE